MVLYPARGRSAISWFTLRPRLSGPQLRTSIRFFGVAQESNVQKHDAPLRKHLKDEAKRRRASGEEARRQKSRSEVLYSDRWELTVGVEIHAQLNADRKLFSKAATSINAEPNSHVSVFDLALPGSQPIFQNAAILPALRAALALNCDVMHKSKFDRKHYFYLDQPAGYQITQFYEPFARGGSINLYDHDGIAPEDGNLKAVGIKQIQLEQDTAKTIHQFPSTLLDFNRVSHPLIEIITLPQIHYPQTAAACVKKIQAILQSVSAVITGMEMGGLRADINVSVRSKLPKQENINSYSYEGITGLGQRTEIKNLSSIKAVEEAIIAESNRQIKVLEAGGRIQGETRGWTLGSTETTKLRAKEGEVDYRYMPDPDLAPLIIDPDLVEHVSKSLPMLPDETVEYLVNTLDLTLKDAKTLVALDNGARLDYFDEIMTEFGQPADNLKEVIRAMPKDSIPEYQKYAKAVSNWVLHELGGLLSASETPFSQNQVSPAAMAAIVDNLGRGRITRRTAEQLLRRTFNGEPSPINTLILKENLALEPLSRAQYETMACDLVCDNAKMAHQITVKGQRGKLHWFVGQMVRRGDGNVEAEIAEAVLKEVLGLES